MKQNTWFIKRVDKGWIITITRFTKLMFWALALLQSKGLMSFTLMKGWRLKHQLSKSFMVVIQPLSTPLTTPIFFISLVNWILYFYLSPFKSYGNLTPVWIVAAVVSLTTRWSGDVIRRTGVKNFNAVSHNRGRPYFRIQHGRGEVRARQVYLNVHSVTGNVIDTDWSVEWKCCREFGNNT